MDRAIFHYFSDLSFRAPARVRARPASGPGAMKAALCIILASLSSISALRLSPLLIRAQTSFQRVPFRVLAQVSPDDETEEQRRARLEELGRRTAEEQAALDSASDDGGLMAE